MEAYDDVFATAHFDDISMTLNYDQLKINLLGSTRWTP
jgi:hypothetical protein